jgi:cysteine synthase B
MTARLYRSRKLGSIIEAVGNTPLLRLERVARSAPSVEVYVKLEFANPGGSVKDRPALRIYWPPSSPNEELAAIVTKIACEFV